MVTKKNESLVQTAAPSSWKDTFVRAAKTFVASLISTLPLSNLLELDVANIQVVVLSAGAAGVGIIINRVLAWSQS